jgi:hypothetical protein
MRDKDTTIFCHSNDIKKVRLFLLFKDYYLPLTQKLFAFSFNPNL